MVSSFLSIATAALMSIELVARVLFDLSRIEIYSRHWGITKAPSTPIHRKVNQLTKFSLKPHVACRFISNCYAALRGLDRSIPLPVHGSLQKVKGLRHTPLRSLV
jgi:hypothetical protein